LEEILAIQFRGKLSNQIGKKNKKGVSCNLPKKKKKKSKINPPPIKTNLGCTSI
jgi:hypothetical protein